MSRDKRLGNTCKICIPEPPDWRMRVPEEVRQSVVYLGRWIDKGSDGDFIEIGTGFVVSVPSSYVGREFNYLVTAKHVADSLIYGDAAFRANTKSGKAVIGGLSGENRWSFHPKDKDSVDAAVTPFPYPV